MLIVDVAAQLVTGSKGFVDDLHGRLHFNGGNSIRCYLQRSDAHI